jgi:paraquat-inducible protein B
MSNIAEQRVLLQAATRRPRRFSIIWIVPLGAVAIGAWLAWDTLSKEGRRSRSRSTEAKGSRPASLS